LIADADQRVYFDGNSKLYDKSDAKWAFVLTADSREAFEDEYPGQGDRLARSQDQADLRLVRARYRREGRILRGRGAMKSCSCSRKS
jgi:hypothetical protein